MSTDAQAKLVVEQTARVAIIIRQLIMANMPCAFSESMTVSPPGLALGLALDGE